MDEEQILENEKALKHMSADEEKFLKKEFHLTKEELIHADEDSWEEIADRLFDMELDMDLHEDPKKARRSMMVSHILSMMTDEAE